MPPVPDHFSDDVGGHYQPGPPLAGGLRPSFSEPVHVPTTDSPSNPTVGAILGGIGALFFSTVFAFALGPAIVGNFEQLVVPPAMKSRDWGGLAICIAGGMYGVLAGVFGGSVGGTVGRYGRAILVGLNAATLSCLVGGLLFFTLCQSSSERDKWHYLTILFMALIVGGLGGAMGSLMARAAFSLYRAFRHVLWCCIQSFDPDRE